MTIYPENSAESIPDATEVGRSFVIHYNVARISPGVFITRSEVQISSCVIYV